MVAIFVSVHINFFNPFSSMECLYGTFSLLEVKLFSVVSDFLRHFMITGNSIGSDEDHP